MGGNVAQGYSPPGSWSILACTPALGASAGSFMGKDGSCRKSPYGHACASTQCETAQNIVPLNARTERMVPMPLRKRLCPAGHKSCPVFTGLGSSARLKGYECVDITNELERCGGCGGGEVPDGQPGADGGRDCGAIPNVGAVSCVNRRCRIGECPGACGCHRT